MQDVNVYIKTTARGPAKRKTVYFVYVIQMKTQQKEYIKRAYGELYDMAENKAELTVLVKALERFNRGCRIRIFTECEHILHSISIIPSESNVAAVEENCKSIITELKRYVTLKSSRS